MMREKRGRVVFISSQAGQCAVYGYSAYSCSKFALRGLAECLQMEVKPFNVLISVSFPPDTDTPQLQEELESRVGWGGCPECNVTMVIYMFSCSYLQSPIANEIASSSGVMRPEKVAEDVLNGVQVCVCVCMHTHSVAVFTPLLVGAEGSVHNYSWI